jgi:hypothetical protein
VLPLTLLGFGAAVILWNLWTVLMAPFVRRLCWQPRAHLGSQSGIPMVGSVLVVLAHSLGVGGLKGVVYPLLIADPCGPVWFLATMAYLGLLRLCRRG